MVDQGAELLDGVSLVVGLAGASGGFDGLVATADEECPVNGTAGVDAKAFVLEFVFTEAFLFGSLERFEFVGRYRLTFGDPRHEGKQLVQLGPTATLAYFLGVLGEVVSFAPDERDDPARPVGGELGELTKTKGRQVGVVIAKLVLKVCGRAPNQQNVWQTHPFISAPPFRESIPSAAHGSQR